MDNIEDILRALTEDSTTEQETRADSAGEPQENGGGLFDGLDIDTLTKLMEMFETLNTAGDNERFLMALKPLLREENRCKIDSAMRFMKLFALIPLLRESGMLGRLL